MKTRYELAVERKNPGRPPVWFMRQAGRYHGHYQELRKKYSFIELCKIPEVACEATMGPIRDFDFDAAILFSDLLFPLEAMGMGLSYPVGPKLDWHLKTPADLDRLAGGRALAAQMQFQAEALQLIRAALPAEKALLGFVGGPLTLYCYAVEGTHSGGLESSKAGLKDGRYAGFIEKILDLLAGNMILQAKAGATAVAVLDTCAGEFDPETYRLQLVPAIRGLLERFRRECPDTPVVYYSKGTQREHWQALRGLPFQCLGVDWHPNLAETLREFGDTWAIQGNVDPHWLFLEPEELEARLRRVFGEVKALPASIRAAWVAGLGHGVLPKTPESNVRLWLKLHREIFAD
jgi:uroporphyrinogen decarboxylase